MYLPQIPPEQPPELALLSSFKRKECLPLLTDEVWKIEQGFVRNLTWHSLGQITTLGLWGPGDVVGLPLTKIKLYQIECLTPVVATPLPLSNYSQYWREALLNHLWRTQELFGILHHTTVSERLLEFFHWLAQRFGQPVPDGRMIEPMITHQELSEILGTSRSTVTRSLIQLEKQGKLVRLQKRAEKWPGDERKLYRKGGFLVPERYQLGATV